MTGAIVDIKKGKLTFEIGEEKIEFILERLLKNTSLRGSGYLVDLITSYVQERASRPPLTNKLEDFLLDGAKVEKDNTKTKVYGEVMEKKSSIPANRGFEVPVVQGNEPKNHKPLL